MCTLFFDEDFTSTWFPYSCCMLEQQVLGLNIYSLNAIRFRLFYKIPAKLILALVQSSSLLFFLCAIFYDAFFITHTNAIRVGKNATKSYGKKNTQNSFPQMWRCTRSAFLQSNGEIQLINPISFRNSLRIASQLLFWCHSVCRWKQGELK